MGTCKHALETRESREKESIKPLSGLHKDYYREPLLHSPKAPVIMFYRFLSITTMLLFMFELDVVEVEAVEVEEVEEVMDTRVEAEAVSL